ncbi:aminomethyl-transferring glycine dehydrogenase subunit GcvPA [candidate division TA06 bacterium]|uniref:Probable glycine dehydrogenase (decarboxylating) subunit 1 n=1 Tax=candidate division TA06 bacterium TaxID=2250710 RepID=A0A933IFX8_UNCT6|nr:aminomethyl-transferring glycine dehydrogenase subunit GcvPA [candidate division TA06 bacterium]
MPYIPNTDQNREAMLKRIGVKSFDELIADIPEAIRLKAELKLPKALAEMEAVKEIKALAEQNKPASSLVSFLGGGAYDHYIPAAIDHILLRSEFYTAYTPYQAEVSQGTLQAIYEFQSLITALTGMDAANASMYDGATALAEAGILACNHTKRKQLIIARTVHPAYRQVLTTYAGGAGIAVVEIGFKDGVTDLEALKKAVGQNTAGVLIQHPNFFGHLEQVDEISVLAHQAGAVLAVSVDPISLGLLKSPGEYGADIVTGEGQPLGMPTNLGGPYLGLFAVRTNLLRLMPGRLVGLTTDAKGQEGAVLTLQTREQHIRREKATSNICSNEALCALAATAYLSLMGRSGLKQVAELCLQKSHYLSQKLKPAFNAPFFKEFVIRPNRPVEKLLEELKKTGILGGLDLETFYPELKGCLMLAVTEKRTREELDLIASKING